MEIPVLDFSVYEHVNANVSADLEKLSEELKRAFTEVGFVYLKNTGITQEEVEKAMSVSKKFFILPEDTKKPFSRGRFSCNENHGWVSLETESLNPRRPGDLKEAYNITSLRPDIDWPSDDFRDALLSFFLHCKELSLRVLRLMALGLGLDSFFLNAHKQIGSDVNATTLRSLYYPPLNSTCVKENQLRCGEHSDYGSITLLFQSPESGLQVRNRAGEYVSAPSIPGTVLINIADLMQRWTSDVYVSAGIFQDEKKPVWKRRLGGHYVEAWHNPPFISEGWCQLWCLCDADADGQGGGEIPESINITPSKECICHTRKNDQSFCRHQCQERSIALYVDKKDQTEERCIWIQCETCQRWFLSRNARRL